MDGKEAAEDDDVDQSENFVSKGWRLSPSLYYYEQRNPREQSFFIGHLIFEKYFSYSLIMWPSHYVHVCIFYFTQ